jgi:hypothetical protein
MMGSGNCASMSRSPPAVEIVEDDADLEDEPLIDEEPEGNGEMM